MARGSRRSNSLNRKIKRSAERLVFLCFAALLIYLVVEYRASDRERPTPPSSTSKKIQSPPGKKTEAVSRAEKQELRVMTWNVDWFQDTSHGPRDDDRQYQGVKKILQSSAMSLIGLVEVASVVAFDRLVHELKGYSGVLSNYRWTQKTGLLYAKSQFDLEGSMPLTAITTARRPPLEVRLRRRSDGLLLYVIVVHAKAKEDTKSYRERVRFSKLLKSYLDEKRASVPLIVLGDFNDLLTGSITPNMPSPYQNFVNDPQYLAATRELNTQRGGEKSGRWGSTIDHILLSDELAPHLVKGSVDVVQKEMRGRFTAFTRNISDHYPVTLTIRR
jgi:exonuclease III